MTDLVRRRPTAVGRLSAQDVGTQIHRRTSVLDVGGVPRHRHRRAVVGACDCTHCTSPIQSWIEHVLWVVMTAATTQTSIYLPFCPINWLPWTVLAVLTLLTVWCVFCVKP